MEIRTLLLRMLSRFGVIKGRMYMQKLMYFYTRILQNPVPRYKLHLYGPYSQDLADVFLDCVEDGLIHESREGIELADPIAGKKASEAGDERMRAAEAQVQLKYGCLTARQLEIMSTIDFLRYQHALIYEEVLTDEALLSKVNKAKGNRFSPEETQAALAAMHADCLLIQ